MIVDQAELIDDWSEIEAISNRVMGSCQRIFTAAKDSKELREAEKQMLKDPELVTLKKKEESSGSETSKAASNGQQNVKITKDLTQCPTKIQDLYIDGSSRKS